MKKNHNFYAPSNAGTMEIHTQNMYSSSLSLLSKSRQRLNVHLATYSKVQLDRQL